MPEPMKIKPQILLIALALTLWTLGCSTGNTNRLSTEAPKSTPQATPAGPHALPNEGFKAQVTLVDPPAKMRASESQTLKLHVKNESSLTWWMRGAEINPASDNKFYIGAGYHWLDKDSKRVNGLEGHNAIPRDLKSGEAADMTLQVTAPKDPGEYSLEVDMVQEQVAWFKEKGSPTAIAKVTVVK